MTDFTIIRRSMLSRLFSTVTTVITVAVAVGLMLVLLSMRDAGRRAFERGSGNMHLLVSRDSSPLEAVLNGVFYAKPPQAPIRWDEYERLSNEFPLEYAIPVQQGDSYHGFPTLATTREFFEKFHPATDQAWSVAQGRLFEKAFEAVFGAAAAKETGVKIGDKVVLTHGSGGSRQGGDGGAAAPPHVHEQFKFAVVGILGLTGTSHDRAIFTNLESSWILHAFDRRERAEHTEADAAARGHDEHEEPMVTPADLTPEDKLITGIYMRVAGRPGRDATALLPSAFDTLRRDRTVTVAAPSDQIRKLFGIVASINQVFLAMAAAVMVSSGIAIMLALYNSMEQRRRQIAVLRVLGASRARIFGLVVTESALVGILGAAAGFILCVVGGLAVAGVMKARLGLIVEPAYRPEVVLGVIAGTILLAAVAGLVPAVMAYRTSVAKNLRPMG